MNDCELYRELIHVKKLMTEPSRKARGDMRQLQSCSLTDAKTQHMRVVVRQQQSTNKNERMQLARARSQTNTTKSKENKQQTHPSFASCCNNDDELCSTKFKYDERLATNSLAIHSSGALDRLA